MDQQHLSTANDQRPSPTPGSDSNRMPRAHVGFDTIVCNGLPVLAKMADMNPAVANESISSNQLALESAKPIDNAAAVPIEEHSAALKKISELTAQLTNQTNRIQSSIEQLSQKAKPASLVTKNIIA